MAGPGAHLWEAALFIQEGDDAHGLEGQQVQGGPVVGVVDVVPGDALCAVLLLLHHEHVLHKELLQVLVGQVDAELLEAAGGKVGVVPVASPWHTAPHMCTHRAHPQTPYMLQTVSLFLCLCLPPLLHPTANRFREMRRLHLASSPDFDSIGSPAGSSAKLGCPDMETISEGPRVQ